MKRVHIVSDDVHTRAWVRDAVSGMDVRVAEGAATGLTAAMLAGEIDLAVVDGGHEPEKLLQKAEHAASTGVEVAVLVIVDPDALGSLRLPIRMSSDFLVRGASSDELCARVRALLWPGEEATGQDVVHVDHLTLNLATYQATVSGDPVDFTYLEYALFAFLVTHPNRTYSRETLLRRVWGTEYYGGSRTVDVHVRRIRSKLGPELARRLETVRNVGYLWSA